MKCNICGKKLKYIFSAEVLRKYTVKYYYCEECGYIQTEEPYWVEESYKDAITNADTGIMMRNECLRKITTCIIDKFFDSKAMFCDYGGGYGILTRMLRDIGFDYYWYDKYADNKLAREFEYKNQKIQLVTAFELFEHLNNPIEEIKKMLNISRNILFCTELYEEVYPEKDDWWYYCFETGQHISFYSLKTLKVIANKFKLNLYSDGKNIHLLTEKELNSEQFKYILNNYESEFLKVKQTMISRTFSDMNIVKLNNGINKIKNLEYGFYNFIEIAKNTNVVIFGTGSLGKRIFEALKKNDINVIAFADNDEKKWNTELEGIEIIDPGKLLKMKENIILIGSSYYIEISKSLVDKGIDKESIFYINGV